jgi:hypothetical protein
MIEEKTPADMISDSMIVQGITDHSNNTIYVDSIIDQHEQINVLFHELFHAVYSRVGGFRLSNVKQKEEHEDEVITQITPVLLETLRKNGALTAALLRESDAYRYIGEEWTNDQYAATKEKRATGIRP